MTFERSRARTLGRGVATVHVAPWTAIADARVHGGALRAVVEGYSAPRNHTADPHAVGLRRGQDSEAAEVVRAIQARAAGEVARAQVPVAKTTVASGPGPAPRRSEAERVDRLLGIALWVQLVALVGGALAVVAVFVVVVLALS